MKALFTTSMVFFTFACGSQRQPVRVERKQNSIAQDSNETGAETTKRSPGSGSDAKGKNSKDNEDETGTHQTPGTDLLLVPELKDPQLAKASFEQTRVVKSAEWGTQVPVLKIGKQDSDFVEILRCSASHALTLPDGRSLSNSSETKIDELSPELLRWAWIEASGNANVCQVVSRRVNGTDFQDLASPSGSHYYVLNPCVAESYLATGKTSNCSFRLKISSLVEIGSSFKDLLRDKLSEHFEAQAEATGILSKLQYIAERIAINRDLCEKGQIVEQRSANLWNGLVQLATIGLTGVVGSNLSAVPLSAAIDGKKVSQLAVSLFGKQPKLPPSCAALEADFTRGKQLAEDYELAIDKIEESATDLNTQLVSMRN